MFETNNFSNPTDIVHFGHIGLKVRRGEIFFREKSKKDLEKIKRGN
jgi:hypothetical protein